MLRSKVGNSDFLYIAGKIKIIVLIFKFFLHSPSIRIDFSVDCIEWPSIVKKYDYCICKTFCNTKVKDKAVKIKIKIIL